MFVHVTRLDSPQPVAQHDGLPANGEQPTTTWVKGEYITDEHTLTLPPDIADALRDARPHLGLLAATVFHFPTIGSTNDAAATMSEGDEISAGELQ